MQKFENKVARVRHQMLAQRAEKNSTKHTWLRNE